MKFFSKETRSNLFTKPRKLLFLNLSFLLVLIIFIFFGLSLQSYKDFYDYKRVVHPDMEMNLKSFSFFFKNNLWRNWLKITAIKTSNNSELSNFYLTIDEKDLKKLNSNLPISGKEEYVKADLEIEDDREKKEVKLRYRGDTSLHWLYPKKSFRIKLKNEDVYNFNRIINFINPPNIFSIIDCITYDLAEEIGLMGPDYYPVRVFVNNKYSGVHMFLSQIDEYLLRKLKRMPGSIYYGDGAPRGANGVSTLWTDEQFWEKKASRNTEAEKNREDIIYFIDAINNFNDYEFYNFVNQSLSKNQFYKFFALDVIFAAAHHGFNHNHRIYFDPYLGKFEPFEWDLRWWASDYVNKDASLNPLINRVKLNPILESERDKIAYDLYSTDKFQVDSLMERIYSYRELMYNDVESDYNRDHSVVIRDISPTGISVPFSMTEFINRTDAFYNILKNRRKFLEKLYSDSNISYKISNENGYNKIIFKVDGNSGSTVNLTNLVTNNSQIYKDTNLNGIIDNYDVLLNSKEIENIILYPGRKIVEREKQSVYSLGLYKTENTPLYYTFFVIGDLSGVTEFKIKNTITGEEEIAVFQEFEVSNESDSIHPWLLPVCKENEKVLNGKIQVNKDLVFDKCTSVKIQPGTTFYIAPEKSIYFYGTVSATGSSTNPIKFVQKTPGKPWGIIAVQGQDAADSKFEYIQVSGGSIARRNLIDYPGQFNIHDVDNFKISNCIIGENFIGDDSLHVGYGSGVIEDCVFKDALSDAVDIDIADVKIRNNIFMNSGNDLLDLMTSTVEVDGNIFINGGDKGISVGEWSSGTFRNNLFYGNNIGIEVKDKSVVDLEEHILIVDSVEKGVNLYRKNDRYDEGGTIKADNIYIIGNAEDIVKDEESKVEIKEVKNEFPLVVDFSFLVGKLDLQDSWNNLEVAVGKLIENYE